MRRRNHIPGEAGLWLLLFGDMTVFAVLFGLYLHARSQDPELFASSQSELNANLGALNTLVLLTSSLLVVWASTCMRTQQRRRGVLLLVGSMALGGVFIVIKVFEYHDQIASGNVPSTNMFFTYYFALTGLHLAHLVLGLLALGGLAYLLRRPDDEEIPEAFFEGGACLWHTIDLLWIVIFPLIFLVR